MKLKDSSYTAKESEEVNRKCRPRNTTVQLSTLYTDHEPNNPTMHSVTYCQTDSRTDGRTDNSLMPRADHSACSTIG